MSSHEHHEEPMWELIYQLLSPEEEAALLRRITSDPDLARAYAKVKLQSELVALASRYEDPHGRVVPPDELMRQRETADQTAAPTDTTMTIGSSEPDADDGVQVAPRTRFNVRRVANWLVATAALGLLVTSVAALTDLRISAPPELARSDSPTDVQAPPRSIRTVVTSPAVWNEDTTNFISVRTSSLDGEPTAVDFDLKLFDIDGEVQQQGLHRTDATGAAQVEVAGIEAARAVRWEVALHDDVSPPLATSAKWARSGQLTHLTTDLPAYQPGDTVAYRSLTLSRLDQRVDQEATVEFEVLDQQGVPVPDAQEVVVTDHGVGQGEFKIPADSVDQKLTLLARSPTGAFPEQRREVQIRTVEIPHWHKEIKLTQPSYEPGDQVAATLTVTSHDGQPAAGKQLSVAAFADQQSLDVEPSSAQTDDQGRYDFHFSLPRTATLSDAAISVQIEDDQAQEQVTKAIPLHTGSVDVQFFAEGGELAAGLRNEVYFQARNLLGQPVHLEGRIVDDAGEEVARAVTVHAGRGRFALSARADAHYRLLVDKPASAEQTFSLPAVSPTPVALHNESPIYQPSDDIALTLRMRSPDRSLVLAAACRGSLVGLQAVEASDFNEAADGTSECQRRLQLTEDANGVIRITVYDSTQVPPTPLAERLVYRHPSRRLQVHVDPIAPPQPGSQVSVGVQTRDERGEPVAAALGVSVVNQALLNVATDQAENLETHIYLTSELPDGEDLEDANFYLGSGDEAAEAMDLLLGTHGWRRFIAADTTLLANAMWAAQPLDRSTLMTEPTAPYDADHLEARPVDPLVPIVLDNRAVIERERTSMPAKVAAVASSPQHGPSRESSLRRWATVLLFGGLLLLGAVIVLAITQSLGRPRTWVPSVAMAGIAAVLGLLWLGSPSRPTSDLAHAPAAGGVESTGVEASDEAMLDSVAPIEFDRAEGQGFGLVAEPSAESEMMPGAARGRGITSNEAGEALDEGRLRKAKGLHRFADQTGESMGGGGFGGGSDAAAAVAEKLGAPAGAEADTTSSPEAPLPSAVVRQLKEEMPDARESGRLRFPKPDASAGQQAQPASDSPSADPAAAAPIPGPIAPTTEAVPAKDSAVRERRQAKTATLRDDKPRPQPESSEPKSSASKKQDADLAVPATAPIRSFVQQGDMSPQLAMDLPKYGRIYFNDVVPALRDRETPATLLWQPLVITDAEGRATISFTMPPKRETYLLRADAHGDGRIGSGRATINTAPQP